MVIIHLLLSIIILGSLGIWIYLFIFLKKSFSHSPKISTDILNFNYKNKKPFFVSVIIPARNEEKYIKKCIFSLLNQDCNNYEIILVDDGSTDNTVEIAKSFNDKRMKIVSAGEKPEGWIGKNWPCFVGYKHSVGDYLLFTDADTVHSNYSIRASSDTLTKENLDALTVVPNLIYPNFIVKMVLPVLSVFMFSRYSPMRVNNPKVKLGYLFGSFFIMPKKIYEELGTHESVRMEIVEDGALGKKIKEMGYNLKMFRGEQLLQAYWARDFKTLWNSLKRLIIPIYFTDKKNSILMTISIFIMMLLPFLVLIYSILSDFVFKTSESNLEPLNVILIGSSLATIMSIYLTNFYQLKRAGTHRRIYCLGTPLGCIIISISFIWSLISSERNGVIKWRDRTYNYNKNITR